MTGVDFNNISGGPYNQYHSVTSYVLTNYVDEDVDRLKAAVWRHKVIVVKAQHDLDPKKQWELVTRLDPKASDGHSHGDLETFRAKGGLLAVSVPTG